MSRAGPRRGVAPAVVVALAAALTLALGGCITDGPAPSVVPTATPEPEATPTVTAYRLDRTIWYGGFVVTFVRATATIDAKGGPVAVELLVGNPGPDDATLDGPILLTAGGVTVEPTRESAALPLVSAKSLSRAALVFEVDADFDVAAAALRVGRTEEHQAIVPLVAGAATTVTLEPQVVELGLEGQAGSLFIELYRAELRADLPDWRQQLDRGVLALTLTYDATFRSEFPGGFAFTGANVALRLPDGTTVDPRRDGHSQSVLIIDPGNREVALQSRFEIPVPGPGAYALVVKDGTASKDIPFEIPIPAGPG